jgi:Mor family transcriptional regulator
VKSMGARRNELLAEVAQNTAATARDLGIQEEIAEQLGAAVADALADHWGGQVITIPKDHFFRLSQRDRKILDEHRAGASFGALARRWSMTERGVRILIRRARARDRNLDQHDLFNAG